MIWSKHVKKIKILMNLTNELGRCCSAMRRFLGWLHQYLRIWGKTILNKLYAMVSFLFLILKPVLFLMLKKFFKKQMKAFIISAIEWLVLQTDNDLDDKILAKVKSWMKLGVVWSNAKQVVNGFTILTLCKTHLYFCC